MQYDFTLAPNGAQVLEVSGSYFTYKNGTGPIRVTSSGGAVVDLLPGQGMSAVKFDRLTVKDLSGAGNVGAILAGDGAWRDERIAGTVDVVDGGKARTIAGLAFIGYAYCFSGATKYAHVQLFNPQGSGRNLHVGQVGFYSSTAVAQGIVLGANSTPLDLLERKGANKRIGGAASVAEVRTKIDVTHLTNSPMAALAKELTTLKFLEPIMVPPGWGLILLNAAPGEDIGGTFEYFEEPV